ncbi:hypothetical protein PZ938_04055 [Luteipulveratus sp. YIM 133132]|uniref:hypothetical protein n=1 Tax=Luteipulveratus flavus TaxID=3031728 RepID=UPI0023AEDA33|nr:hypothetical protein [Luteipulveratus sp. YIM 133132]MDE9364767.1 hypothetical protein [Luteipulveratus sp. YIM 133132]
MSDLDAKSSARYAAMAASALKDASTFLGIRRPAYPVLVVAPVGATATEYFSQAARPGVWPNSYVTIWPTNSLLPYILIDPSIEANIVDVQGNHVDADEYVRHTLTHEMIHVLTSSRSDIHPNPSEEWLREGGADYFAYLSRRSSAKIHPDFRTGFAGKVRRIPTNDDFARNSDMQVDPYDAASSVMTYIDSKYGAGSAKKLYLERASSPASPLDSALTNVLGTNYANLEKGWLKWIQQA